MEKLGLLDHVAYHEGLDLLGRGVGASVTRRTDQGVPDVVWAFPGGLYFTFEAKTEKTSGALSKKDLLEATGHVSWVRTQLAQSPGDRIAPLVVAPAPKVLSVGMPHVAGLYYVDPPRLLSLAERVAVWLADMRVKYAGRDYASSAAEFSAEIRAASLTVADIEETLRQTLLEKVAVNA